VRSFESELGSLLANRQHGSRTITAGIAELLLAAPFPSPLPRKDFITLAHRILASASAFALLHDLFHVVGSELYGAPDADAAELRRLRTAIEAWYANWNAAQEATTACAVSGLEDEMTLATISNSRAVRDLLIAAARNGLHLHVLVSESHPGGEGATFVQSLLDSPHDLTLLSDAALPDRMGEANLLAFGADAVFSDAVMNKVGSVALAEAAASLNCPLWVIAETQKWAPAAWGIPPGPETKSAPPAPPTDRTTRSTSPLHLFERVQARLVDRA
jgi:translation initiation factor 2B subunit (eIF-2B alpha/beta/delta family)